MVYYVAARNGSRWTEYLIHNSDDCSVLRDSAEGRRPIGEASVDGRDEATDEVTRCDACFPDADEEDYAGGTCEVVMNNGKVCGRERPCQYHD